MFTQVQQCIYKYIHVQLACTLHTYANTCTHFYHSRRREISHSHLTPSHSEHKKSGCSSAREQQTFSLTAAHKRTSTGQQLLKPTLTWKRRLPSLQGTNSKQHHTHSQHLQVQTVSKDANWRSTPQLRTTLRATAPHYSGWLSQALLVQTSPTSSSASGCFWVMLSKLLLLLVWHHSSPKKLHSTHYSTFPQEENSSS